MIIVIKALCMKKFDVANGLFHGFFFVLPRIVFSSVLCDINISVSTVFSLAKASADL